MILTDEIENLRTEINNMLLGTRLTESEAIQVKEKQKQLAQLETKLKILEENESELDPDEVIDPIVYQRQKQEELNQKLAGLQAREREINKILKIANKEEKVQKLEEKLAEMQKEASYFTDKPDKNGYVTLREEKYQARLKELHDQLDHAKTSNEKWNIKMKIFELKMMKTQIKSTNAAIKIGRGVGKVSGWIKQIGDSFSGLSDMSGFDNKSSSPGFNYFGESKTTRTSKKSKKKKKGKKSRKKKSESSDDSYGWNTKSVFDI